MIFVIGFLVLLGIAVGIAQWIHYTVPATPLTEEELRGLGFLK